MVQVGLSSPPLYFHSVSLPTPPSALTCLFTAQTTEQKRGNIQAHGPPICLPSAGQGRDWWRDWLLIGCGSPTLNMIGFDFQRGWGGGGGTMVWNLEETRDRWSSASKGTQTAWDRELVTMTFLSNDPTGRLYLAVVFVCFVWCFHFCTAHHVPIRPENMWPCALCIFAISVRKNQTLLLRQPLKKKKINSIKCS